MKYLKKQVFYLFFLLLFVFKGSSFTVEIPLDQFGETTKVAYVNMHKLFEAFPETEKARYELNRLIEQRRSEITLKKEAISTLKAEIDWLKTKNAAVNQNIGKKIDSLKKTPPSVPSTKNTPPSPTQIIEYKGDISSKETPEKPEEEGVIIGGPSFSKPSPKKEVKKELTKQTTTSLELPVGSPLTFLFDPENKKSSEQEVQEPPVKINSSAPAVLPGIPSPAPQLKEKQIQLRELETDLEAFVGGTEQEIQALEEGKTMILLAQIYQTLQDISKQEGYSLIINKEYVLYGKETIDITENVIWRLNNLKRKRF